MKILASCVVAFLLFVPAAFSQAIPVSTTSNTIAGHWHGSIPVSGRVSSVEYDLRLQVSGGIASGNMNVQGSNYPFTGTWDGAVLKGDDGQRRYSFVLSGNTLAAKPLSREDGGQGFDNVYSYRWSMSHLVLELNRVP